MGEIITISQSSSADAIRQGYALAGYCSFTESRKWAAEICGDVPHDVWYTERNGDPITLVVPSGMDPDRLPSEALGYSIFRWIKPEDDFDGPSLVVPLSRRKIEK